MCGKWPCWLAHARSCPLSDKNGSLTGGPPSRKVQGVQRIALYPGSFDPPTNGHLSIIHRGLKMFDGLIVAVLRNPAKDAVFSVDERVELLKGAVGNDPRVQVKTFEGLLVKFAEEQKVNTVLRGLRAVSDFEYEFQMANMNRKLDKEIETLFMMTGEDYFYISSRFVRDVARLGGEVDGLVPKNVLEALKKRFAK
jgi:pantetheine-phosphate adenylyltransferase